ncbi:MAG: hypothetical protein A3I63_02730 [Betaproteobacteria bacterium RIFCSPLOWO2_02_FULL_66_14]|nr:MAG: hypothetical protein A3I63_02730 [Betaproteobacteria bacterium RIFCSPLOWO2_02_FULL_66_14]
MSSAFPGRVLALISLLAAAAPAQARSFECLTEPNQVVEIRSPVEGVIEKVNVQRGDSMRKGQILVELESDVERSAADAAKFRAEMLGRIESAKNRLAYAQGKSQRAQKLQSDNFISAQAREEAETERRLAESELKDAMEGRDLAHLEYRRALEQLKLRRLASPFAGVVTERLLNPGDLAESGSGRKAILKVAEIDPLRVEVVLPLEMYGKIRTGASAIVTPDSVGGRHSARVTVVDRVLDAASGTFGVRLELRNPQRNIPAGVRCQVDFGDAANSPNAGNRAARTATKN